MATLTVTNGNDSGPGSLRDTIATAESGDRIQFEHVQTINISTGAIKINKNLIIEAPSFYVTIDGLHSNAIFNMSAVTVTLSKLVIARGFDNAILNAGGDLTIVDCEVRDNLNAIYNNNSGTLTISNSKLSYNDVAIYNAGILIIQNSTLSDNWGRTCGAIYNEESGSVTITASTLSDNTGMNVGAIYNDGTLTIQDNSTLSGNKGATDGGAIYNDKSGSVTITASKLSDNITDNNNGGAVFNKGIFTIKDKSSLSANNARMWGGAIYNDLDGTFTIEGSSLTDNVAVARGAISNAGTLTIINSTLSGNSIASTITHSGGIGNDGTLTISACELTDNIDGAVLNNGQLTIEGSTFSQNESDHGGAIYNVGALIVKNSDLSNNVAFDLGGAIYNKKSGSVTIEKSKLFGNSSGSDYGPGDGGAIYNEESGSVTITASTLSGNTGMNGGAICNEGTLTVQDNSTLSGNKGATDGGAIYNEKSGSVTITTSTLSGNITDNITGNNGGAVFNKGIFTIKDKSSLSANNAKMWGGAIYNDLDGTFTIADSSLTDNVAFACGAISNAGTLTINNSTLSGNSITSSSPNSGAIGNSGTLALTSCELTANSDGVVGNDGRLTIEKSTFSENKSFWGGAIYNFNKGALVVKTSELSNNVAELGGAIYNEENCNVTIEQSILSGNSSGSDYSSGDGGAIYNEGTLTIRANSTLSDNVGKTDGGAIYNIESGSVTITASTLSGNITGNNGGAVFNKGIFTITDKSTLSANVGINGGAICNLGTLTIQSNCTLSGNIGKTDGGAIYNEESGSITIEQSILSGNSSDDGGAIVNQGTLTIKDNCTLFANTASRQGGAIYNNQNGIFTITGSSLLGNKAIDGGAIFNNDTALTIASSITNTELKENNASNSNYKGGAVYNNGILLISACTIESNGKTDFCGAIYNHGQLTIDKSTLSENIGYLGGAINTDATLIVRNCTLEKNTADIGSGGAINITGATSSTRIDSSTLVSNNAGYGGAIYTEHAGPLTIINSTLSQNEATMEGDALYTIGGKIDIFFSTIANNQSYGSAAIACTASTTTCKSSILANPFTANCYGSSITGINQNLCTDESCPGSIVVSQDDLKFEPLAMNPPGTTQTYALQEGSVAINIVEACNVAYDQRGVLRPKSGADAGAYEKAQELLAISENTSPEHPIAAQQFTYTINIRNLALVPLNNVTVTDKLPAEFDFITASEGYSFDTATREVTWPPAAIEVDQPLTVTVTVLPRNAGTFINSVSAAIIDYPTAIDNYPTIVYEGKMLAIDNEASPENPIVGYPFTYTINVRNTGQSPVKHVTVTDKLPDSVEIVTSSEQHLIRSGGEVTWTLDVLSPGQSITLTLKVRPRQIGLITNTITATSPDSQTTVCTYQTIVQTALTFAVNIQTITSWSYPAELRSCCSLCSLEEFLRFNMFKLVTLHTLGGWAVTGLVVDYDDCIVRLTEAILS